MSPPAAPRGDSQAAVSRAGPAGRLTGGPFSTSGSSKAATISAQIPGQERLWATLNVGPAAIKSGRQVPAEQQVLVGAGGQLKLGPRGGQENEEPF